MGSLGRTSGSLKFSDGLRHSEVHETLQVDFPTSQIKSHNHFESLFDLDTNATIFKTLLSSSDIHTSIKTWI